jgi:O-antigen biosynthesis protein
MELDREAVLRRELALLLRDRLALHEELAVVRAAASAELQATRAELGEHIDRLSRDLSDRDALIAALYASTSWRISAPVRVLSRLLSKPRSQIIDPKMLRHPVVEQASKETAAGSTAEVGPPARVRRTVLVAAPTSAWRINARQETRVWALLAALRKTGWWVALGCLETDTTQPEGATFAGDGLHIEEALHQAGVSRILQGLDEIQAFLAEAGGSLDWVLLSGSAAAIPLMPLARSCGPTVRIAYDLGASPLLRHPPGTGAGNVAPQHGLAHGEGDINLALAEAADVVIVTTLEAQAALLATSHELVVARVPNAFAAPTVPAPGPAARKGLLWVASVADPAVLDAMRWFLDAIWPCVRWQAPDTVLQVAGAGAAEALRTLDSGPDVEWLDRCDDAGTMYNRNRAFVAPFRAPSTGLADDIGEAAMHGLPVVATRVAAADLGMQPGEHVLEAEEPEEFARQIVRLLRDDSLWSRFSAQGQQFIANTFSVDALQSGLGAALGG